MARKVNLEVRKAWRQRIERQRRSGLAVAEFSRQEGVSEASFYLWKRKLQGEASPPARRPAHRRPVKTSVPSPRTVPLAREEAAFVQLPLASAPTSPWIELVLPDGTIIRLPQQNLAALQTVLRACDGTLRVPARGERRHV